MKHLILPSQENPCLYISPPFFFTLLPPNIFTFKASLGNPFRESFSTMKSGIFHYMGCEDHFNEPHFLESCFLCRKHLGLNSDIFMYRGNTPFCSKECRQEQIEIDEGKDKKGWKLSSSSSSSSASSSSKRAIRKSDTKDSSPNKSTVRTGAVVVS